MHTCVGLTIGLTSVLLVIYFCRVVNYQWVFVDCYKLMQGEIFLVTHVSIIASIIK